MVSEDQHHHVHYRMYAKRPTQIATIEHTSLPLHVQSPPVPFLSWEIADHIMRLAASQADETMWFTASSVYRDESCARVLFENRDATRDVDGEALLLGNDIDLLIESKFAVATNQTLKQFNALNNSNVCCIKLFSTVEHRTTVRRRMIGWPASLNIAEKAIVTQLEKQHVKVRFYSAREVRDNSVKFTYAASLDFKKFYQQFELLIKHFWIFTVNANVFMLSTIPTGAVFPPLFTQALSRTLLALAIRCANVEDRVNFDCCIDNLRLLSDDLDALWAAWHELIALCKHLGATIGEMNPPPATHTPISYTYLGMFNSNIDGVACVELAVKSKDKLRRAIDVIHSAVPMLVVDALALFGQTIWACTVTNFQLGRLYHVIKFIRRTQRNDLNSLTKVWPSIVQLWTSALEEMITKTFVQQDAATSTATMFTDASESGWGVVILDYLDRPIRIFAGRWSPCESKESINMLELRALRIGIRILAALKSSTEVLAINAFIDNTTARAWATRARAPRWCANQLALSVDDELRSNSIQLKSITYVESARNIADKPSRMYS
jgi:hypothetical protein